MFVRQIKTYLLLLSNHLVHKNLRFKYTLFFCVRGVLGASWSSGLTRYVETMPRVDGSKLGTSSSFFVEVTASMFSRWRPITMRNEGDFSMRSKNEDKKRRRGASRRREKAGAARKRKKCRPANQEW